MRTIRIITRTTLNVRMLLDTWHLRGEQPLPRSLARQLLVPEGEHSLEEWLASLPDRVDRLRCAGQRLVETLERCLEPDERSRHRASRMSDVSHSRRTALVRGGLLEDDRRSGRGALRQQEQRRLRARCADRETAGAPIAATSRRWATTCSSYYRVSSPSAGLTGKALVGDLPFRWRTDFDFAWMGGWLKNQERERTSAI